MNFALKESFLKDLTKPANRPTQEDQFRWLYLANEEKTSGSEHIEVCTFLSTVSYKRIIRSI